MNEKRPEIPLQKSWRAVILVGSRSGYSIDPLKLVLLPYAAAEINGKIEAMQDELSDDIFISFEVSGASEHEALITCVFNTLDWLEGVGLDDMRVNAMRLGNAADYSSVDISEAWESMPVVNEDAYLVETQRTELLADLS